MVRFGSVFCLIRFGSAEPQKSRFGRALSCRTSLLHSRSKIRFDPDLMYLMFVLDLEMDRANMSILKDDLNVNLPVTDAKSLSG